MKELKQALVNSNWSAFNDETCLMMISESHPFAPFYPFSFYSLKSKPMRSEAGRKLEGRQPEKLASSLSSSLEVAGSLGHGCIWWIEARKECRVGVVSSVIPV